MPVLKRSTWCSDTSVHVTRWRGLPPTLCIITAGVWSGNKASDCLRPLIGVFVAKNTHLATKSNLISFLTPTSLLWIDARWWSTWVASRRDWKLAIKSVMWKTWMTGLKSDHTLHMLVYLQQSVLYKQQNSSANGHPVLIYILVPWSTYYMNVNMKAT